MKRTVKRILPQWNKDIKKALIQRDMSVTELAAGLGISRVYCSQIINNIIQADAAPGMASRIGDYLGVPYPNVEVTEEVAN